ncbi:hypothetical protein GGD50_004980 [Rhizobium paranaense]|uniref:Transposase IS30-like HTH domain-containing protein n=1 Tax=Rhizobium paranaense TaxID=1650438 RepID=A0A7W8XVV5_9HYPH|nr:hypothetical protein [Rhizobium paranaense]
MAIFLWKASSVTGKPLSSFIFLITPQLVVMHYSQLTLADRRRLHHLVERKVPINEIARKLGRHRSTINREIRRNTLHDRKLPEYSGYVSTVADDIAKKRRRRLRKLRRHRRPQVGSLSSFPSHENTAPTAAVVSSQNLI